MVAFTIPNIVGTVVLLTVAPGPKTKGGLVAAYYCMMVFGTCYPAIILLLSRNVAGQTKKSVVYAVMCKWHGLSNSGRLANPPGSHGLGRRERYLAADLPVRLGPALPAQSAHPPRAV